MFFLDVVWFFFNSVSAIILFQWGTQLELAFSNTSPSWCAASTKHKAHWLPSFGISPQNHLMQCINPVQEQFSLVGLSKCSPRQSFSSLGWAAQLLLKGHWHSWFEKPWSQKADGRAKSRFNATVMRNLICTQCECLPSSTRTLQPLSFYFPFLNRTKPISPSKSLVNIVKFHTSFSLKYHTELLIWCDFNAHSYLKLI